MCRARVMMSISCLVSVFSCTSSRDSRSESMRPAANSPSSARESSDAEPLRAVRVLISSRICSLVFARAERNAWI